MGALGIALGAAMFVSDVVGLGAQEEAMEAQKSALAMQAAEKNLQFAQKTANNISTTRQNMEIQAVQASGMGESLSSPTLKAITLQTFQTGKKDIQNNQTAQAVSNLSYQNEQHGISEEEDALPFQMMGQLAQQGGMMKTEGLF